jgi:probable rRNA maturation factor
MKRKDKTQHPTITLDLQITQEAWKKIPRLRARLAVAAEATNSLLPKSLQFPATATVLLTGNADVRRLNKDFRGLDKATNVLSFPQFSPPDLRRAAKTGKAVELGDIAIARQYTAAEARAENKELPDHLTHLLVHGLLHLFGYDHLTEAEAEKMEKLEIKILKSLGVPNPYGT